MAKELLSEFVATRITETDAKRLTKLALQERRPEAWLIREAILQMLERDLKS